MKKEKSKLMVEVENEGMLIDVEKGTSSFLNETGLLIYKMLKDGAKEREITKKISKGYYDADKTEVRKDLKRFKKILEEKGVL